MGCDRKSFATANARRARVRDGERGVELPRAIQSAQTWVGLANDAASVRRQQRAMGASGGGQ